MAYPEQVVNAAAVVGSAADPIQGVAFGAMLGLAFFLFALSTARGNQEDIDYGLWGDVRRREGGWILYPFAHWGQAISTVLALWLLYSMGIDQPYLTGMAAGFAAVNVGGLLWFAFLGGEGTSFIYLLFIMAGQTVGCALSLVAAVVSFLAYVVGMFIA
jgi:hypothetical protein